MIMADLTPAEAYQQLQPYGPTIGRCTDDDFRAQSRVKVSLTFDGPEDAMMRDMIELMSTMAVEHEIPYIAELILNYEAYYRKHRL